jgi:molecular chaperone HscB
MGQERVVPAKCTTCKALAEAPLACKDCRRVFEHVMGASYFELFGLPATYEIDTDALHQKYLIICRNTHPDQFVNESPEASRLAMRLSAQVNRAYETLRDPLLRAEYLIEAFGGKSAAEHKTVPQDLLQEVMGLREDIEEAAGSRDAKAIGELRERVLARREEVLEQIAGLARQLEEQRDEVKLNELRERLNAVKYFENLRTQL